MNETSEAGDKDLLDELMGKGVGGAGKVSDAKTELPDGPLPPRPDPNETLEVHPVPAKSPAQALDAAHATEQGGEGFELTIEGQAYTRDERGNKAEQPYRTVVKVAKLEGAMSLLRKVPKNGGESFLDATVRKIIGPTFRGVRTYNIVGAVPRNAKTPAPTNLQYMTLDQLRGVAKERAAGLINLEHYGDDVVALRDSLMDFFQNPRAVFEDREKKRAADIVERRGLEALNK